jgi:hypothetical protein
MDRVRKAFSLKFHSILRPYWAITLFCIIGAVEFSYFTLRGLGNDFPVFYDAGQLFLNFQSPWGAVIDPIHSAYLNGPLTALVISPLAIVPQDIALGVTRAISIILIPFITFQVSKYFSPLQELSFLNKRIWLASSFILFAFPIRANLEYGQFFVVFLALAVSALRLSICESNGLRLCSGFLIGVCCDYKPQSFLIFALLICFRNRYIFLGGILAFISSTTLSTFLTDKPPYLVWGKALLTRFEGGVTGDQMHIYALFPGFWSVFLSSVIATFALIHWVLNRTRFSVPQKTTFIIFITVLLSPWLHPTDLVLFGVFAVGIATWNNGLTILTSLALGTLLVWSNNLLINVSLALISAFILYFYLGQNLENTIMKKLLIALPPVLFALLAYTTPDLESTLRRYLGLVSIVSITALVTVSRSEEPRTVQALALNQE